MSEKKILFVDDKNNNYNNSTMQNVDIDTFDEKSITVNKLDKVTLENDENDDDISLNESFDSKNESTLVQ